LSANGSDIQYYDKTAEKFYRVDKNGATTQLSDKIFYDVQNVVWSPDKNRAIIEYPMARKLFMIFRPINKLPCRAIGKILIIRPMASKSS